MAKNKQTKKNTSPKYCNAGFPAPRQRSSSTVDNIFFYYYYYYHYYYYYYYYNILLGLWQ